MNTPLTFRVADLSQKRPTEIKFTSEAPLRQRIADDLGLNALKKFSFTGTISANGKTDWTLSGRLGATVVQDCVVTLEPVTTRIDEDLLRHYLADWEATEDPEAEMAEDVTTEPLEPEIDVMAAVTEALSLALPAYPRAENAELAETVFTEPGAEPLTDDAVKPFAGLADLKKKLESGN